MKMKKCTHIDFVAESSTERICGWWKQSTNVTHTADFELLRLSLNHLSVVQSQQLEDQFYQFQAHYSKQQKKSVTQQYIRNSHARQVHNVRLCLPT